MKPPKTLTGRILLLSWLRHDAQRRVIFAAIAAVFAVLAFFPRQYHASVQIIQPSANAAGLNAVLGQLGGNYAALLSTGQPYEINLQVGRTYVVEAEVVKQMGLVGTARFGDLDHAVRTLRDLVTVRSLRGGIIGLEVADRDPEFALKLATIYARVYSQRLAQIARQQTNYKRDVLNQRMREAAQRLTIAQANLNHFRQQHQLPGPDSQLQASIFQLAGLKSSLQAKRVQLQSMLQFATTENIQVRSIQAEIASLEGQIAAEQSQSGGTGSQTPAGIAKISAQYENLVRDEAFAQLLYEAYTRYLEGSAVEDLSAAWNLQMIQPPYVHPGHQINKWAVAVLLLILLAAIACEVYLLFPPMGAVRRNAERED